MISHIYFHRYNRNRSTKYLISFTETAILSVLSKAYSAIDRGMVSLLGLLDLSAAFDTVDHEILLSRLSSTYGLAGPVHAWMTSFLSDCSQIVSFDGSTSQRSSLNCGVPQGSVLGPLLFVLYTAEVSAIAQRWDLFIHAYADDIQLLGSTTANDTPISVAGLLVASQKSKVGWQPNSSNLTQRKLNSF